MYEYEVGLPLQLPGSATSVADCCALPEMLGAEVIAGTVCCAARPLPEPTSKTVIAAAAMIADTRAALLREVE
jgi:hypothetical protein